MTAEVLDGSGAMFDRIAARYDLLNRVHSLGLDLWWRQRLVSAVVADGGGERLFLDVATGTGDVAIALAERAPAAAVVALDPSTAMLDVAEHKLRAAALRERVAVVAGDVRALPFPDHAFDGATMAFGIRNVRERARALAELHRVLRPGGRLGILELCEPAGGPMAWLAQLHVHHVVPLVGRLVAGGGEYRYLERSISAFPRPAAFAAELRAAGFADVDTSTLTFGVVGLWCARRGVVG